MISSEGLKWVKLDKADIWILSLLKTTYNNSLSDIFPKIEELSTLPFVKGFSFTLEAEDELNQVLSVVPLFKWRNEGYLCLKRGTSNKFFEMLTETSVIEETLKNIRSLTLTPKVSWVLDELTKDGFLKKPKYDSGHLQQTNSVLTLHGLKIINKDVNSKSKYTSESTYYLCKLVDEVIMDV